MRSLINACSIVILSILLFASEVDSTEISFVDVTEMSGIDYPPSKSYGASWMDFDNDGNVDLYITNHGWPTLYHNSGNGNFSDVTLEAGVEVFEDNHGGTWADFDRDGDVDLYQTVGALAGTITKQNFLYRNEGGREFVNISDEAGVTDPKGRSRCPLWFDYNNDGCPDLFIANLLRQDAPSVIYQNNNDGTFTQLVDNIGIDLTKSFLKAYLRDLDGDSLFDIILVGGGRISVYLANGDGTYDDYTVQSGLAAINGVVHLAFGDFDKDHDEDIYVCRADIYSTNVYQVEDSVINFELSVKDTPLGFDFSLNNSTAADFDIFTVAGRVKNTAVYIGQDKFNPDSVPFSVDSQSPAVQGQAEMDTPGVYIWYDVGQNLWKIRFVSGGNTDLRGGIISSDGSIGFFSSHGFTYTPQEYSDILAANNQHAVFSDVTFAAGLAGIRGSSPAATFADFDNDGDLDLYIVRVSQFSDEADRLYKNVGGFFYDVSEAAGISEILTGKGESVAAADYNNDGLIDLLVLNGLGRPPFGLGQRALYRNGSNGGNWFQARLEGVVSTTEGIGATVRLITPQHDILQQQHGGVNGFSQNSETLHFGIGDDTIIQNVSVYWPSGIRQNLGTIDVNQIVTIKEPVATVTPSISQAAVFPGGRISVRLSAENHTTAAQEVVIKANVSRPGAAGTYPRPPGYLFGPYTINLAPNQSISGVVSHTVPAGAPTGVYNYNVITTEPGDPPLPMDIRTAEFAVVEGSGQ